MKFTLADITPRLDQCRQALDARKAGITGDTQSEGVGIALNREGSVRRVWRGLSAKDVYLYQAYLMLFTDASNNQPSGFVDNPMVGDGHFDKLIPPGRYRNAYVIVRAVGQDKYDLIQELRMGFIQSLVTNGVVDYSEARLVDVSWYNGDGGSNAKADYKTIQWVGVDPERVHGIVADLMSISPTGWSPTIRGESLGSHHRLFVRPQEAQDGSQTIRLVLANPRTSFTSYEGRRSFWSSKAGPITYHFDVPKDLVSTVLATEEAVGKTATVTPPDQQGLCHITVRGAGGEDAESVSSAKVQENCSSEAYLTATWGAASDSVNPIPASIPAGTSYERSVRPNGDGTWDILLRRTVARRQSVRVPEYKPDIDTKIKSETHRNLPPEDLSKFLNGTLSGDTHGIDFTSENPDDLRGVSRRIIVDINPNCTLGVRGESSEPDAADDELDPPIGESKTVLHDLALYWNQDKDQVLAILAGLAAQEDNITKQVEIRRNNLGVFDLRVSVRTHTPHDVEIETITPEGGDATLGVNVQARAGTNSLTPPDIEAGPRERIQLSVQADEKGGMNWSSVKQTVQAVDEELAPEAQTGDAVGVEESVEAFANIDPDNLPEMGPVTRGVRLSPSMRANDDGTLTGQVSRVEVHPNEDIEADQSGALLRNIQTDAVANDRSFDPATALHAVNDVGKTITFRGTANTDGTVSWMRVTETAVAVDKAVVFGRKDADFTLTVEMHQYRNQLLTTLDDQEPPEDAGVDISYVNVVIHDNKLCDYIKITQTLVIGAGGVSPERKILEEDIWQKRDQPIRTRIPGYWSTSVQLIGRKTKRRIERTITRTNYLERPTDLIFGTVTEGQRKWTGETRMGPFTVYYIDKEDLVIGEWEADGEDNGMYHYALAIPAMEGPS